jgi:hypothetical protein
MPKLRTDAPCGTGVRSNTTTERPRRAASHANAKPTMPEPITATSALCWSRAT